MFPAVNADGTCAECGRPRTIGDWPQCPHEKTRQEYFPDEIPGGMLIENGVPEPVVIYSRSELSRLRDAHGWQVKEKWCPFPGTDVDPAGVMNPANYKDEYTLKAGAALMLRAAGTKEADIDLDTLFVNRESRELTHAEMQDMLRSVGEPIPDPTPTPPVLESLDEDETED